MNPPVITCHHSSDIRGWRSVWRCGFQLETISSSLRYQRYCRERERETLTSQSDLNLLKWAVIVLLRTNRCNYLRKIRHWAWELAQKSVRPSFICSQPLTELVSTACCISEDVSVSLSLPVRTHKQMVSLNDCRMCWYQLELCNPFFQAYLFIHFSTFLVSLLSQQTQAG